MEALEAIKKAKEQYQSVVDENVSKLKDQRKGLQDQIDEIDDLIKELTGKAAGSSSRVSLDDDKVLAFIGKSEKTAKDIEAQFGCSYITAGNKLKALEKSKKLVSAKDGNKVLYKVK